MSEEEAEVLAKQEGLKPFDLGKAPLLAIMVAKTGPTSHVLLVTMHHAIVDGWSLGRVLPDMLELCYSITQTRPSSLPELPFQFSDFAAWEQAQLDQASDAYRAMANHWTQKLAGPPGMLQLPLDKPRPSRFLGTPSVNHGFILDVDTVISLKQLATSLGCSLYAVFLALFR